MQYSNITGTPYAYPDHNIDPSEKGKQWCMDYAKAAMYDWNYIYPKTIFYNNGGAYELNRLYAIGQQPVNQYKTWLGVDKETNDSWLNISWEVRPIVSKYRDIAIARLIQQEYGIVATAIDPTAKSELDHYYAQAKAKIMVRKLMEQKNPELAGHPLLQRQPGEPVDMEEMEMRIDMGEQFNRSKDAEMLIQLGLYENDAQEYRRRLFEDLFDYGVAGYKEWLSEDNKPKFRKVNPECVVTNYCRKGNFDDLIHAGEVIDVALVDLALIKNEDGTPMYTEDQLTEMAVNVMGKWGNPNMLGPTGSYYKPYDKFKVKVFDISFFTYNNYYSNSFVNSKGNLVYEQKDKAKSGNRRYSSKRIKYVYECKWIIGTDYAYDWGMAYDQKRDNNPKKKAETRLPYKFYAYNFYEMRAQSMMDRLRPLIDDYQLTVYKIQNFKNRAVPSGWWIDLDALENVGLSKGGKNMTPMQLLDMFFQTGVLVGRSTDITNNNVNYKPVIPIENTAASELAMFYQDLQFTLQQIQGIVGLNEITDGSTPNPKTLVPGYENANIATNNALFPLSFAEKQLFQSLGEDIMCRTQQGIKKGGVSGYAPAINSNTLQFVEASPDMALREYGIMLEEKSTEEQKQLLMMNMQQDKANGFLDTSDEIYVLNTYNIKMAQQILGYRVKKAKEAIQQEKMMINQQTIQGQQQSAQLTAQMAAQALQLEWQLKTQYMEREMDRKERLLTLELQGKAEINNTTATAKVVTQQTANQGKLEAQGQQHVHNLMEQANEPAAPIKK